jgi:hypothetical protein
MNHYSGAALFIDILGIDPLTRGKIALHNREYAAWGVTTTTDAGRHHILAAKLLMQFRRSLVHTQTICTAVKIAQLSDSAFVWAADPVDVVNAARTLMWHVLRAGLLCRAGLAYGRIVEPDKVNRSLGQFVLGDAVTKAAGLEGKGKGARVFCDSEVAHEVLKTCRFKREPFTPLRNPLDGSVIDEFRWYLLPKPIQKSNDQSEDALATALGLAELLTTLRYSPRLGWNDACPEGRLQVACTVESVSQRISAYVHSDNYAFIVEHLMEAKTDRSAELQAKVYRQFKGEIVRLIR